MDNSELLEEDVQPSFKKVKNTTEKLVFKQQEPFLHPVALTKREHFAGLAMQGLCASNVAYEGCAKMIKEAVELADELIKQLNDTITNVKE